MGNNPVGHFLQQDVNSIKDFTGGLTAGIEDTFSGKFDYSDAKRDFENYGNDVKNAFTGGSTRIAPPTDFAQQQIANYNRAINPQNSWNKVNWQTYAANSSGSTYGNAVGNDNVKPSDLLKISDPTAKMAVASTRGAARQSLMVAGANIDRSAVGTLAGGSSGVSQTIPSAGGQGSTVSGEDNQSQLKQPNTTPTGSGQAASGVVTPSTDISNQSAPNPSVRT